MPRCLGLVGRGPIEIKVASSAGTHFSGEKSHESQACPLAKTKRLQELLFGVMEGRVYGVDGRDRQGHPGLPITNQANYSENANSSISRKVCGQLRPRMCSRDPLCLALR